MASNNGIFINNQYFSGAQSSVFIGDMWVEDITSLEYNVQHGRTPIYGYGEQYFSFVPKGNILVTGSFTINFREPNYLWMILQRYSMFNISNAEKKKQAAIKKLDDTTTNLEYATDNQTFQQDTRMKFDTFFKTLDPSRARDSLIEQSRLRNKRNAGVPDEKMNHRVFAITIGYGDEINENTIGERINAVHILGKGKILQADGRPIQEQYQFIARSNT